MKKTIDNGTIHTVNGVDTRTGATYVKQVRTFTPLPNGFNADLANYVFDIIVANRWAWDQNSWRRLLDPEDLTQEELALQQQLVAFELDMTQPTCGTAMCFAGWVSEVTGGDYVVDTGLFIKPKDGKFDLVAQQARDYLGREETVEMLLMPWSEMKEEHKSAYGVNYWYTWDHEPIHGEDGFNSGMNLLEQPTAIVEYLASRGFTPATHAMVSVPAYADIQLGFFPTDGTDGDPLYLFNGGNSLYRLRASIDIYTAYGPSLENCPDGIMRSWHNSHWGDVQEALGLPVWVDPIDAELRATAAPQADV